MSNCDHNFGAAEDPHDGDDDDGDENGDERARCFTVAVWHLVRARVHDPPSPAQGGARGGRAQGAQ